jgi:hypothetical protein
MEELAIVVQATGKHYEYAPDLMNSITRYFMRDVKKTVFVFTDMSSPFVVELDKNCSIDTIWSPTISNCLRYFELLLSIKDRLANFKYVYKLDADMIVYNKISPEEIFPSDDQEFSIVQHFYAEKKSDKVEWKEIPRTCSAWISPDKLETPAWQSCLFGGRSHRVIEMADKLNRLIESDSKQDKLYGAWEEPYVNWYMNERRIRTLPTNYAAPLKWHFFPEEKRDLYRKLSNYMPEKIFHFSHTTWDHRKP